MTSTNSNPQTSPISPIEQHLNHPQQHHTTENDPQLKEKLKYWTNKLKNLNHLQIPTDYPRPMNVQMIEAEYCLELDQSLCRLILKFLMGLNEGHHDVDYNTTTSTNATTTTTSTTNNPAATDPEEDQFSPFLIILSAYFILLYRHTQLEDLCLQTIINQNAFLLRLHLKKEDSFLGVLYRVKNMICEARENEIDFEYLLKYLGDQHEGLVGGSGVGSGNNVGGSVSGGRIRFVNHLNQEFKNQQLATDLNIFLSTLPTTNRLLPLTLKIIYNTLLFRPQRIEDLCQQLILILRSGMSEPGVEIGRIKLVTEIGRGLVPDPKEELVEGEGEWVGEWPGDIAKIFNENAKKYGDKILVHESLPTSTTTTTTPTTHTTTNNNTRTFTYQQLNTLSTILAHSLLQSGLSKNEVVMIYASRNTELLIAILAVLRAGLIFSVIDPQYPIQRQKVYLRVARARGMIVLDKAGGVDSEVLEFIKRGYKDTNEGSDVCSEESKGEESGSGRKGEEESDWIKCFIPGLELTNDGQLLSHPHPKNPLHQTLQEYNHNPSILDKWYSEFPTLTPDSIGTLSFTSGSTGIPKGVLGRHYSLTAFYPFMQQTFGLNDKDKFTMLSGIAHDPIQRDIFTPFFVGGQICIPTLGDIQVPGRLARWIHEMGCSVTHLTPAMGQLLTTTTQLSMSGIQIKSLKNAFFVGDLLTKRDVLRMKQLCPHLRVINMYGTTETQRAVSYYAIDKENGMERMKELMPAGIGMRGVQLLVLGGAGQCGIGEVGEIYVRSYGLAEGYLSLPDITKQKFLFNPFVTNPIDSETGYRDRMYKTGDLGRYTISEGVECCGRIDDQIKIRGFRIELGELDLYLSQHPYIKENVTLVRRDRNEEKTLVSYCVLNEGVIVGSSGGVGSAVGSGTGGSSSTVEGSTGSGSSRVMSKKELGRQLREWMLQKVPVYSVPSLFVPLGRMPLTPNGKIDKNALPYPDTALLSELLSDSNTTGSTNTGSGGGNSGSGTSEMERRVMEIWKHILKLEQIGMNDDFFAMGGHSILATRLIFELRELFKVELEMGFVFKHRTVRQMAETIEGMTGYNLLLEGQSVGQSKGKAGQSEGVGEAGVSVGDSISGSRDLNDEVVLPESIKVRDDHVFVLDQKEKYNNEGHFEPESVFMTGVTGFLGAFLLDACLKQFPNATVKCLVRAKNVEDGWQRVCLNMMNHLLWTDTDLLEMRKRVLIVLGDLSQPWLGVGRGEDDFDAQPPQTFLELSQSIDCIVHNGALVHWVYPYETLKAANVNGTLWSMKLSTISNRLIPMYFISSTSVLDSKYYTEEKLNPVLEGDDLEGSRFGLGSGYAQSKWVCERLLQQGRQRGLPVCILRPGYILGSRQTGVTNTDDFLVRLMKGCLELGTVPKIHNVINVVSVDYCSMVLIWVMKKAKRSMKRFVFHIWNPQMLRYTDYFQCLSQFGYSIKEVEYLEWREQLQKYTLERKENALFPLLHFVMDDLPTSSKSALLDDSNLKWVLEGSGVEMGQMCGKGGMVEVYLMYLCHVGFLEWPSGRERDVGGLLKGAKMISRSGK